MVVVHLSEGRETSSNADIRGVPVIVEVIVEKKIRPYEACGSSTDYEESDLALKRTQMTCFRLPKRSISPNTFIIMWRTRSCAQ